MDEASTAPEEDSEVDGIPSGWRFHYLHERHQQATLALIDVLDSALPATRDRDSLEAAVKETGLRHVSPNVMAKVFALMQNFFDEEGFLRNEDFLDALFQEFIQEDWLLRVWDGFNRLFRRMKREPVLLSSLLISAAASFESFMAGIFETYYTLRPDALHAIPRDQEKEFSLAELKTMESLDEAIEIAVSRRVDSLMFGGNLLNWNKFLKDNLKVDMSELAVDWLGTREIFERRHVLAHQGGLPGTRYATFVRRELKKEFSEESDLRPSEAYVRSAIQSLYSLAVLLGAVVSTKLEPESDYPVHDLLDACYEALVHGQFEAALHLSRQSVAFSDSESSRWVFRVNEALSLKRLGRTAEATSLANGWDLSAAAPVYVMAKAAILDDLDAVFALMPVVIQGEDADLNRILEWPLLTEASEDPRMEPLRKKVQVALGIAMADGLRYNQATGKVHRVDCRFASGDATVSVDPDQWPDGATRCQHCFRTHSTPVLETEA